MFIVSLLYLAIETHLQSQGQVVSCQLILPLPLLCTVIIPLCDEVAVAVELLDTAIAGITTYTLLEESTAMPSGREN